MAIETDINKGYVYQDKLVSTQWVAEHLEDPNIRVIESNEDQLLYPSGHISGAVEVDWMEDLNDPVIRDYLDKKSFEKLASRIGITPDTTVVFYGDKSNWWACYALWVFELFRHTNTKIMDGGRLKWEQEDRQLVRDKPTYESTSYSAAQDRDDQTNRAFKEQVLEHLTQQKKLLDVRSPPEFKGELTHMEAYPQEGVLRGGHIPGAVNKPWSTAANEDGTFKTADELKAIYKDELQLQAADDIIVYCRIGERSSHSWFMLKYLLGYEQVRNYDGSYVEWGNLVRVPIERS